jgi:hypothetical protein
VRVKCLHALLAQTLVMGAGVNPIGDRALEEAREEFDPRVCRCAMQVGEFGKLGELGKEKAEQ